MTHTNAPVGNEPVIGERKLGNHTFAVGSVLIHAPAERIWQILTDYSNTPEVFANIKSCKVLQDNGSNKIVHQTLHPKGSPMNFDYILEVTETAPSVMKWHRKSGALKEVDGSWTLEPSENSHGTKVTYSIFVDGGVLLPPWLLRGQSKNFLPELLTSLKKASERSEAEIPSKRVNAG